MDLTDVLRHLAAREPIFHRPEVTSREEAERLTADDFWEIGASGKIYDRAFVIEELERRARTGTPPGKFETSDFACRQLGRNTYLLTYTLIQNETRKTRRSTIWRLTSEGWKIVFHQGTIVAE
jgi:hypothetical protein